MQAHAREESGAGPRRDEFFVISPAHLKRLSARKSPRRDGSDNWLWLPVLWKSA